MNLAAQIFEQLDDANRAAAQHLALGREQGQRDGKAARDALRAVVASFELAKKDPSFKCPSYLMAAIECAAKL